MRRGLVVLAALVLAALATCRGTAAWRERTGPSVPPPHGQLVPSGDVALFVQQKGPPDGPPVVFVHGTGSWSELWRDTLDAAASAGFRTVALDLPPFGWSERPAGDAYRTEDQARRIRGAMASLGLRKPVLVGHSFGARSTLLAALRSEGDVGGLVLVDPALGFDAAEGDHRLASAVLAPAPVRTTLAAATVTNPYLTRRFLAGMLARKEAATDARVALLQAPLLRPGTTRHVGDWMRVFLTAPESTLRGELAARPLTVPVTLVWGTADTITPIDQGRRLLARMPGAQLVELDGLGHIPQIEDPARFNAALLAALARRR